MVILCSFHGNDPLPLVFTHVVVQEQKLGKQVLIKKYSKGYVGMGGVTGKGRGRGY